MPPEVVAADLTSLRPVVLGASGKPTTLHPSFCLPWFRGEPPMTGAIARDHRRGSTFGGYGEARLRPPHAGRRHFGEIWLALSAGKDDFARPDTDLRWCPDGENWVTATCEDVIAQALNGLVDQKSFLGLVVPDALGPGAQQTLRDGIERHVNRLHLVPRPAAVALAWCADRPGRALLARNVWHEDESPGYLAVMTSGADYWELAALRLKVKNSREGPVLCPVRDRTRAKPELPVCGITQQFAHYLDAGEQPETAWTHLLRTVPVVPSTSDLMVNVMALHAAERFLPNEIVPNRMRAGVDEPAFEKVLAAQLDDPTESPLALIYCGPMQDGAAPAPLSAFAASLNDVPLHAGPDLAAVGGREAVRRIIAEIPSYFERLTPLDLYVEERNRFRDPVPGWRALIESLDVEAGSEYRTAAPITDLAIPGAAESMALCLRRDIDSKTVLRSVSAPIAETLPRDVPAEVSAHVRPGQGFARVEIRSREAGVFSTSLDWRTMEATPKPPDIRYGWSPGIARIVEADELAFSTIRAMRRVIQLSTSDTSVAVLTHAVDGVRQTMNVWLTAESFRNRFGCEPPDVDTSESSTDFIYFAPFSSDCGPRSTVLNKTADAFGLALESLRRRGVTAKKLLSCASWLYVGCPESFTEEVRRKLRSDAPGQDPYLFFAGNVFSQPADIKLFFRRLHRAIVGNPGMAPNSWLRAYRNIARYRRHGVLPDVLPDDRQRVISDFVLRVLKQQVDQGNFAAKFNNCLYVIPHMLKRRRYDRSYLRSGTQAGDEFHRVIERVTTLHELSFRQQQLAAVIVKLLEFKAKEATLRILEEG